MRSARHPNFRFVYHQLLLFKRCMKYTDGNLWALFWSLTHESGLNTRDQLARASTVFSLQDRSFAQLHAIFASNLRFLETNVLLFLFRQQGTQQYCGILRCTGQNNQLTAINAHVGYVLFTVVMTTFTAAPSSGVPYADALMANAVSDDVIIGWGVGAWWRLMMKGEGESKMAYKLMT